MATVEQIARVLVEHQPTTGMSVAMGVTCRCGYWSGNEVPGKTRPVGFNGLMWHQAEQVAALDEPTHTEWGIYVPAFEDEPGHGDAVFDSEQDARVAAQENANSRWASSSPIAIARHEVTEWRRVDE